MGVERVRSNVTEHTLSSLSTIFRPCCLSFDVLHRAGARLPLSSTLCLSASKEGVFITLASLESIFVAPFSPHRTTMF